MKKLIYHWCHGLHETPENREILKSGKNWKQWNQGILCEILAYHEHPEHHGILYLTKGAPLIVPELELEIHPEPGDYYFFPPLIKHYVNQITEDKPARYNVIFNIAEKNDWEKNKAINKLNGEIV